MIISKNLASLLVFVGFLSLPIIFNSCQPSGGGKNSGSSDNSSFTVVDLNEKYCSNTFGASGKLAAQSSPFAKQKVYVNAPANGTSQKAAALQKELVVLIHSECLSSATGKSFAKSIVAGQRVIDGLDVQAFRYQMPDSMSVEALTELAEADQCIKGISRNRIQETMSIEAQFSDTLKSSMLHLNAIEAAEGYEILYGSRGIAKSSSSRDVHIAVVDTGVDVDHPDLDANIWKFALPGENKVRKGYRSETYGDEIQDYNPVDRRGHGTHIAGLIGAVSNNGIGMVGTMPYRSKIMAISADSYYALEDRWVMWTSDVINGVRWAALQGADVINISSGDKTYGPDFDQAYFDAMVDVVKNARVVVVTSAGNDTSGNRLLDGIGLTTIPAIYAANQEGLISVASTNAETKALSYFSIHSTRYVEIAAPGTQRAIAGGSGGLVSTMPDTLSNNSGFGALEGSSQSSALVSAAAGLVVGWIREKTGGVPYPCVVEGVLKESAENVSELDDFVAGGRHLNLKRMAKMLQTHWP
jgi:hypothetical protein